MIKQSRKKIVIAIFGFVIYLFLCFLYNYFYRYSYLNKCMEIWSGDNSCVLLLGSAVDKNHLYKDIYSVSLKLDSDSTGAYIYFADGSIVHDGSVTRLLDGAVIVSWSQITTSKGETLNKKGSISFSYSNYFPNGFYITEEHQIFDYTGTVFRTDSFSFFDGEIIESNYNQASDCRV